MDEAKRTYRNVKTDVKKTARGIDGTDRRTRSATPGTRSARTWATWATMSARLAASRRAPGTTQPRRPSGRCEAAIRRARCPPTAEWAYWLLNGRSK